MDTTRIIVYFYPTDDALRRLLILHSSQVCAKALELMDAKPELKLDRELVADGAMLHDIGIIQCHAPGIFCNGTEHYLRHGLLGGEMLRTYGAKFGVDLEACARICERHTGTGLSANEIRRQGLPLPEMDFLPETLEEKLICLADKFYSKSNTAKVDTPDGIRRSMAKFGQDTLDRLDELYGIFL